MAADVRAPAPDSASVAGRARGGRQMLVQACINGSREVAQHPRLSADATLTAADAARAVAAGAGEIHVHPKDAEARDSLAPDDVARWVRALREACPGIPIGVTTGAWIEPDVERRLAAIDGWTELPDFASVNWHEAGADEVAAALRGRGIAVEAGIWDGTGLEAWRRSPEYDHCMRVLVELPDEAADTVRRHAEGLIAHARRDDSDVPILLHGEQRSAWPALILAIELGLDSRIGLEDTLHLPDGQTAPDNASLVRTATALVRAASRAET